MKRLTIALVMLALFLPAAGRAKEPAAPAPGRDAVIRALNLVPMNDGACTGYYRETYTSTTRAAVEKDRPASSLIYYFMPGGLFDPWHKLSSDEILVYHAGAPMKQLLIYPDGRMEEHVLGPDPTRGHSPQIVIPANTWMGFRIMDDDPKAWGLYGVFCSPGWHIEDISLATGAEMGKMFPQAVERMKALRMFEP